MSVLSAAAIRRIFIPYFFPASVEDVIQKSIHMLVTCKLSESVMCHTLMQQGTLDVRFPPGMRKIQQTRCEGMSYQPRMSFPQESRPRMSGEPISSARRITSTGTCSFPARKDLHDVRTRPFGHPLKGISARPGRYPRWKQTACSVFQTDKVQSAFHVARFHLPCSGKVFLYTAPEAADVVHEIEYRLLP